jgi:hypothetical protein
MESNERYFARRASEELRAADRAITGEGRARRRALAETFLAKARECRAAEAARGLTRSSALETASF